FGHSPAFVTTAIRNQIEAGFELGPQSFLAGRNAEAISALTGMPRVAFCSSGTEAVMTAVRLARLVTGRDKVAIFAGSYHGTFDGLLAMREVQMDGQAKTVPIAPGIPPSMVGDVMVLTYNEPRSLETIGRHSNELAAVLTEPIQSRRPDVQPREFLHELRRL